MKDIECPYCGFEQDINHDDGYGYTEGETFSQECESCGKTFVYETEISFYYDVNKADCLNGGKHKWELSNTIPKCFSRMVCTECGESRDLTDEEREKYSIPTNEEYFNGN